ncbi:MAG: DUF2062 domain-containing protein [Pseudomonadota bacterium]
MFARRTPRTILQNLKELFWPEMGWVRAFKYAKLRIVRLSDTTQKIALGLAIGAGISFTPLVGTHFIQAGIVAYLMRANILAALIGTFVGTPWTFPFMWWMGMTLGSFLLELFGMPASANLPDEVTLGVAWDLIKNDPYRIFLPWALGGYLIAFLSIPFTYLLFYNLVNGAKKARKIAREKHLHRAAKEMTGQKE